MGLLTLSKVQAMIQEFFNGDEPNRSFNPVRAIALVTIVQAGVMAGGVPSQGEDLQVASGWWCVHPQG